MPAGVLNIVTHARGAAAPIGEVLIEDPRAAHRLHGLHQHGSPAGGGGGAQPQARRAGAGGLNPLLVLADADLDYAVDAEPSARSCIRARSACRHGGSSWRATPRRSSDRLLAAKTAGLTTGDPGDARTIIGPLISETALATVAGRVNDAVARGARVLAGGRAQGPCFQATLITDVPEDSDLARYETFGPVAIDETVPDVEAAIRRANDTTYGLSAGIITRDADRGLAIAGRIDAGIVHINEQTIGDEPQMPFGGVKDSGWGRFGGTAAVEEFTELRWVTVQSGSHPYPF